MRFKEPELTDLLPGDLAGWSIAEKDKTYGQDNLYEYINGGAELYLSYGFNKVISRRYAASNQPDILVDLFDMGASHDAFGVFSHSRETEDKLFGQGSQYVPGLLLFWKDRYFISILANPETKESKEAIFSIARHIESEIHSEGPLPEIINLLPEELLVKDSVLYFHHHIWLNSYYFVAHENILHIDSNTEALFAKYETKKNRSILLIIKYPEETDAKRARSDFIKNYLPELSDSDIVKIEDNTWTGFRMVGRYLIVIFNVLEKNQAFRLLEDCEKKISR
ncbi:MAG: hypothetical protein JRJ39_12440 [Deltaproteobacteria bacterium]|nr:hypothetical protein [Deltaproteobacteria bacterium]MBW1846028.1 hypothetical protein [Deltaproteobacteria bacterium]MBW2365743.1 hypothetical protein [Deltaproteobacteria bacterium]